MTQKKSVAAWLQKTAKQNATGWLLVGCGLGALAIVVLFVSFWCIYLLSLFVTLSISHELRMWISLIGVGLLFLGLLADPHELESYSFTTGTFHPKPVTVPLFGLGGHRGSTINPLAPDSAHSFIKMIAGIVSLGPRLAAEAWQRFRRSWRFSHMDIDGCVQCSSCWLAPINASHGGSGRRRSGRTRRHSGLDSVATIGPGNAPKIESSRFLHR